MQLDRPVTEDGSVLGVVLDSLGTVEGRRSLNMDNTHHPLHSTFTRQSSTFSSRLLSQSCSTDRRRRTFVPPGHGTVQRLIAEAR